MIFGNVQRMHALIPVTFRRIGQPDLSLEFVVDTGFVGYLTLPLAAVEALNLPFKHSTPANLADNSVVEIPAHAATVLWHGVERDILVLAMGTRPLLGMALMNGSELVIQCRESDMVTLDDDALS